MRLFVVGAALLCLAVLSGCGQKRPLYLPGNAPNPRVEKLPPPKQDDTEKQQSAPEGKTPEAPRTQGAQDGPR